MTVQLFIFRTNIVRKLNKNYNNHIAVLLRAITEPS